ncbi:MAG: hypothetical protein RLZZ546_389, partial [Bacteroidota bacterium]
MRPTLSELHDETKFNKIADFHIDDTMKFLSDPEGDGKAEIEKSSKKPKWLSGILILVVSIVVG